MLAGDAHLGWAIQPADAKPVEGSVGPSGVPSRARSGAQGKKKLANVVKIRQFSMGSVVLART
jgi:hypothetical protein